MKSINLRLRDDAHLKLTVAAEKDKRSIQKTIEFAIDNYISGAPASVYATPAIKSEFEYSDGDPRKEKIFVKSSWDSICSMYVFDGMPLDKFDEYKETIRMPFSAATMSKTMPAEDKVELSKLMDKLLERPSISYPEKREKAVGKGDISKEVNALASAYDAGAIDLDIFRMAVERLNNI